MTSQDLWQIRVLNPIIAYKGTYRCQCALDLQATFRKHEGSPAVFGVNAVISTTAIRIRACVALTGSTPDCETPPRSCVNSRWLR